jgi:hypothetical protein
LNVLQKSDIFEEVQIYSRTAEKLVFSNQTEFLTLVLAPQPSKIHVLTRDAGFNTVLVNITMLYAAFFCPSCIPEKVDTNQKKIMNKKWYFHLK